eukprot:6197906-Pleurochrysis_carterae.AAC.2
MQLVVTCTLLHRHGVTRTGGTYRAGAHDELKVQVVEKCQHGPHKGVAAVEKRIARAQPHLSTTKRKLRTHWHA